MIEPKTLVALIYYIAYIIYVYCAIYIMTRNAKATLNRLFLIICVALCIWALSFSISAYAYDPRTVLRWRMFAAFGWGTIYSFLLHFIILLTGHEKWLKNKLVYLALYVPALINVLVFGLLRSVAEKEFNFVFTSTGWFSLQNNTFFGWFFNVYYIVFSIAVMILIWKWRKNAVNTSQKNQATLIFISFLFPLLLGSITDVILAWHSPATYPPFALVYILVPMVAIMYSIRHFGILKKSAPADFVPDGLIVDATRHKRIYLHTANIILGGSMFHFMYQYFFVQSPLYEEIIYSGVLFAVGIFIFAMHSFRIKQSTMDNILSILIVLVIPYFSIAYLDSGAVTVWAIPFFFVIISIMFKNKWSLILINASIIASQIYTWVTVPAITTEIVGIDHLLRIGFYLVALGLVSFINFIYVNRLKETERQIHFQRMLFDISSNFLTMSEADADQKINYMLEKTTDYLQFDQSYVGMFSADKESILFTHSYSNNPAHAAPMKGQIFPVDKFEMTISKLLQNQPIYYDTLESIPEKNIEERNYFRAAGIYSLIIVPLFVNEKVIGILGYESLSKDVSWKSHPLSIYKILANLLANTIQKMHSEKEVWFMAYNDTLTHLPNRFSFTNLLNQAIEHLDNENQKIAIVFADLDMLRTINDVHGHQMGDEVLKKVAAILQKHTQDRGVTARFESDKFLLMLPYLTDNMEAVELAESIIEEFNEPIHLNDQDFFITVSLGLSFYPLCGTDAAALIKNADLAMQESKKEGGNRYTLCTQDLIDQVTNQLYMSNQLHYAIERNELFLLYQPQINIATGKIVGVEALLRWQSREFGLVSPGVFIPLAEKNGLISSIGEWVLNEACL